MKRAILYLFVSAGLLFATSTRAHDMAAHAKGTARAEAVTMNGEIIDPQCYFTHDSRGADHASCATKCATGGQGLSFLDEATGTVYPLIAKTHGASQNEGLIPHLGKPVQVKGVVFHKAGNSVLLVQSVVASPAKTK